MAFNTGAPVNAVDPLGLEIHTYEESGWTPRGYSPYYYGTTFGETIITEFANFYSLVNNSFWVGLQNLNVAMEESGFNDLMMALGPAGVPAEGAEAMLYGTAKIEQLLVSLFSKVRFGSARRLYYAEQALAAQTTVSTETSLANGCTQVQKVISVVEEQRVLVEQQTLVELVKDLDRPGIIRLIVKQAKRIREINEVVLGRRDLNGIQYFRVAESGKRGRFRVCGGISYWLGRDWDAATGWRSGIVTA